MIKGGCIMTISSLNMPKTEKRPSLKRPTGIKGKILIDVVVHDEDLSTAG